MKPYVVMIVLCIGLAAALQGSEVQRIDPRVHINQVRAATRTKIHALAIKITRLVREAKQLREGSAPNADDLVQQNGREITATVSEMEAAESFMMRLDDMLSRGTLNIN